MIPIIENTRYDSVPDDVYDQLEAQGFEECGNCGNSDYQAYRKIIVSDDGKRQGIWKAVPSDAKTIDDVIDITYDQAVGYAPMPKDNELAKELGKRLNLKR